MQEFERMDFEQTHRQHRYPAVLTRTVIQASRSVYSDNNKRPPYARGSWILCVKCEVHYTQLHPKVFRFRAFFLESFVSYRTVLVKQKAHTSFTVWKQPDYIHGFPLYFYPNPQYLNISNYLFWVIQTHNHPELSSLNFFNDVLLALQVIYCWITNGQ